MLSFAPGPSELYPSVARHLKGAIEGSVCSISHRSAEFSAIYRGAVDSLRALVSLPEDWQVAFLGSATEAMERLVQSCTLERSFHVVSGAFAERFRKTASAYGREVEVCVSTAGEGVDLRNLDVAPDTEFIAITQNETSFGVAAPLEGLPQLRAKCPRAIIALDMVSAFPLVPVNWGEIDCGFFSVQKAMGLPAGLGVLLMGPRCIERARELSSKTPQGFHSIGSLSSAAATFQTPETPNVLGIYLLQKVLQDFGSIGLESLRATCSSQASSLYQLLLDSDRLSPFVENEQWRSRTVISVAVDRVAELVEHMREDGLVVGAGYGEFKARQVRVANFPAQFGENFSRLLSRLSKF